jgi:hypothetical protein
MAGLALTCADHPRPLFAQGAAGKTWMAMTTGFKKRRRFLCWACLLETARSVQEVALDAEHEA